MTWQENSKYEVCGQQLATRQATQFTSSMSVNHWSSGVKHLTGIRFAYLPNIRSTVVPQQKTKHSQLCKTMNMIYHIWNHLLYGLRPSSYVKNKSKGTGQNKSYTWQTVLHVPKNEATTVLQNLAYTKLVAKFHKTNNVSILLLELP
jgi:hypothetical protein